MTTVTHATSLKNRLGMLCIIHTLKI